MTTEKRVLRIRGIARLRSLFEKTRTPRTIRKFGEKRALLSYITNPFYRNIAITHCNIVESIKIADEFNMAMIFTGVRHFKH